MTAILCIVLGRRLEGPSITILETMLNFVVKLSKLFNHSDVRPTGKYLGLRNEELMETYELLKFQRINFIFCK